MEPIILPDEKAQALQQDYVCAGCWRRLHLHYLPHHCVHVTCDYCGDGRGFVRRSWTERRREENFAEAGEVRQLMHRIGMRPHRTDTEILKDLGF